MRIARLTPAMMTGAQRDLYGTIAEGRRAQGPQHFAVRGPDGALNGPFNAFLLSPELGASLQGVGVALRYRTVLDDRSREIAILLVAARCKSSFEREAHEAVARALDFSWAELESLRRGDPTAFDGIERAVADAVLALLDGDLDDGQWAAATAALDPAIVFELTTLVGYYSTLALQLRVFRVDQDDD